MNDRSIDANYFASLVLHTLYIYTLIADGEYSREIQTYTMNRKRKSKQIKGVEVEFIPKKPFFDYVIYTDGSGNNMDKRFGASSFVILDRFESKIIKQSVSGYQNVTNNQMELNGIIEAISELPPDCSCIIKTDSQYCINVLDHRMKDYPKNMEYIDEFRFQVKDKNLTYKFQWVKGHAGNKYNELADKLANDKFIEMGGEDYKETVKRIWKSPEVKSRNEEICEFVDKLSDADIEFLKELLTNK